MHRFPSLLSEKSKACPPFLNKIHCVVFQKMKFGVDGCCCKRCSVVLHEVVDFSSYTGELRYHIRFITGVQIIPRPINLPRLSASLCVTCPALLYMVWHSPNNRKARSKRSRTLSACSISCVHICCARATGAEQSVWALCGCVEHNIKPVT